MAQGRVKRFLLTVIFIALLVVIFVLVGGGDLLKDAGKWIGGMGKKADTMKEKIEDKASTVEKTIDKLKQSEKSGAK